MSDPFAEYLTKHERPAASNAHADRMKRAHPRVGEERERGQDKRVGSFTNRQALGPDEAFEEIARRTISDCDKVKCGMDEYVTGLRYILSEIEVAIQAAKETM